MHALNDFQIWMWFLWKCVYSRVNCLSSTDFNSCVMWNQVCFVGESAVDTGGPVVNFWRLLMFGMENYTPAVVTMGAFWQECSSSIGILLKSCNTVDLLFHLPWHTWKVITRIMITFSFHWIDIKFQESIARHPYWDVSCARFTNVASCCISVHDYWQVHWH